MKRFFSLILLCICMIGLMGADRRCADSAEQCDTQQQDKLLNEAQRQTGMPAITNFQERKLLKMLYEMRDQEKLPTWTYLQDLNGKLWLLGRSIGYGIPYATQYSAPHKWSGATDPGEGWMDQAEPNDLYPPSGAEGTWVFLMDAQGDVHPVYIEPRITVSPFPLSPAIVE